MTMFTDEELRKVAELGGWRWERDGEYMNLRNPDGLYIHRAWGPSPDVDQRLVAYAPNFPSDLSAYFEVLERVTAQHPSRRYRIVSGSFGKYVQVGDELGGHGDTLQAAIIDAVLKCAAVMSAANRKDGRK